MGPQNGKDSRGISFQGAMLVHWENRATDSLEVDERNERLLKALLLSQDLHHDSDDEAGDRGASDLARVEAKLDLLLDMVSQILRDGREQAIFAEVDLWLGGVAWCCARQNRWPAIGERLWLSLYIDSRLAQPLKLPVIVTGQRHRGDDTEITADFDSLDESLLDLLSKLIFRQHRRMIARQKADKRSGST